ncbi:MAG: RNA 2',3'-cyclic phosphodiesterase [Clostridiales bacterium]|nr:RNA 2',3'-cyclic phosphodiesterase [Clostridiales bacterium]
MMRLFIGLGLPNNARDALYNAVSALGVRGRMTRRENYHVTLAFLGEHDEKLNPVESSITAAAQTCAPFALTVTGFGFFGRRDSALLYAKLQASRPLQTLADTLRTLLSEAGEPFDDKPFAAHITLMRKADLTAADLQTPPPVAFTADRLTLYHSARVQDVLRYRPVFETKLG